MRKFKKIVRFTIKFILLPILCIFLIGSGIVGGYNMYKEGRYFGDMPKCKYERVLEIDGKSDIYAIVEAKNGYPYYLEKGMSCEDFKASEESKKLKNMFHVDGWKYGVLCVMFVLGTVLDFAIIGGILFAIVAFITVFFLEIWENSIVPWIEEGKPNEKYARS